MHIKYYLCVKIPFVMTTKREAERLLAGLKDKDKVRVLFVCLGNICRSPAAEGVFRHYVEEAGQSGRFEIDSCGFYGGHAGDLPDRRMREHAFVRGYRLNHRSRVIRPSDFDNFDVIIGMDDRNISDLRDAAPTLEDMGKIIKMSDLAVNHPEADCVPDPYYEGAEGFELVLDLLEDSCAELLRRLNPED